MWIRVIDEETKKCDVGLGTDAEFYASLGMVEGEAEQGYDGAWYLPGYAPTPPTDTPDKNGGYDNDTITLNANNNLQVQGIKEEKNNETLRFYCMNEQEYVSASTAGTLPKNKVIMVERSNASLDYGSVTQEHTASADYGSITEESETIDELMLVKTD